MEKPLFSDTPLEVEAILLDRYRAMSSFEKFKITFEMMEFVRTLTLQGLRNRFPNASEKELLIRLTTLLHGAELAKEAWGLALTDADSFEHSEQTGL
jgi:hypothetical protein